MLSRAAQNAYSWWWASHIRTKQSKWLDQNLLDMEEKVDYILKIITEDGDSFRTRAEQYYKKRPEIVNFIEDTFRGYRALAERYDHMSRDLQSANRTIAIVFPERVQMSFDEEDNDDFTSDVDENENNLPTGPNVPLPLPLPPKQNNRPKVENVVQAMLKKKTTMPTKMMSKRGLIKIGADENASSVSKSSGLSKGEALEEIEKLQKDILGFQTEKEFVKSLNENALSKYWEIENNINEMHTKISNLQHEFVVSAMIEDKDAQTLMSSSALKMCEETLATLKRKHKRFKEEAVVEHKRVDEIRQKFEAIIACNNNNNSDLKNSDQTIEHVKDKKAKIEEKESSALSQQEHCQNKDKLDESHSTRRDENIDDRMKEEGLGENEEITISEVAEKIEQLVDKVITIETEVISQTALITRLRLENDELHEHIETLEQDKNILVDNKNIKIKRLEEDFERVKIIDQKVKAQNVHLETRFEEAGVSLDSLFKGLLIAKPDENPPEEKENTSTFPKIEGNDAKGNGDKENESRGIEDKGNKNKANENKGNEDKGNENKGNEDRGNEDKRSEDKGNTNKGNEDKENEDKRSEDKGNEGNGNKNKGNENKGNEDKGNENKGNEDKGNEDKRSEDKENTNKGNEDKGNEDKRSEDKGNKGKGNENKGNEDKGNEDKRNEDNRNEGKGNKNKGFEDTGNEDKRNDDNGNEDNRNHSDDSEIFIKKNNEKDEYNDVEPKDIDMEDKHHQVLPEIVINKQVQADCIGGKKDEANWNSILSHGIDDRERMLIEEYSTTLKNYKEVKQKLNEIEKTNRARSFKSAVQMKILRTSNESKDEEIRSLYEKLKLLVTNMEKTMEFVDKKPTYDEDILGITSFDETQEFEQRNTIDLVDEVIQRTQRENDELDETTHLELKKASDAIDKGTHRIEALVETAYFELKKARELIGKGTQQTKETSETSNYEHKKGHEGTQRSKELDGATNLHVNDEDGTHINKEVDEMTDGELKKARDFVNVGTQRSNKHDETTNFELNDAGTRRKKEIDELTDDGQKKAWDLVDEGTQRRKEHEDGVNEAHGVLEVEEEIRTEIDDLRKENLELWLRFSTSYHQINRFQDSFNDLIQEIKEVNEKKNEHDNAKHHQHHSSSSSSSCYGSDIRPLYRHLRDMQTEVVLWLEKSGILDDDLQHRLASLSDIQNELSDLTNGVSKGEKMTTLNDYQAAKFQGEVVNMKQENVKVLDELRVACERVKTLQIDIEKTLSKLDEELGKKKKSSSSKVPFKSFLFGAKLRRKHKRPVLTSMSPTLQRQYSNLDEAPQHREDR